MKTIIIQTKENKSNLIMNLMREMKINARFYNEEDIEDAYLADLINKGMAEVGEIPIAEIRKKLRK